MSVAWWGGAWLTREGVQVHSLTGTPCVALTCSLQGGQQPLIFRFANVFRAPIGAPLPTWLGTWFPRIQPVMLSTVPHSFSQGFGIPEVSLSALHLVPLLR